MGCLYRGCKSHHCVNYNHLSGIILLPINKTVMCSFIDPFTAAPNKFCTNIANTERCEKIVYTAFIS